ncbi:MAG: helicase-related protein [Thermoleophilia bacterium]
MTFAVGSLVRARGREWVVLPESESDLLVLRPLGGTEDEVIGILPALEPVEPATFALPDPRDRAQIGDYRSARLLRDAVRLGFRSSAGPFRSFGAIGVEPRPYQLVPLLMALKLAPVRLLIADDVGIGKTIEAGLIAKELLARGEVERLAVLCPPALAEQWQKELAEKFHIEAELVLASTAARLERNLSSISESLFDRYPFVVVSTDFIKNPRRMEEFKNACPELVIVDEAHTCASAADGRSAQIQRHRLVAGLAADKARHLILVTATPHSGKEEAFRSLLGFLDEDFLQLPLELGGDHNRAHRRRLARHFVQRRRGDIRHYLHEDTPFPEREELEETYKLSPEYKKLFARVLRYARETVTDAATDRRRQRVRWWSALALLRSLASSPAAAAATMRTRAAAADTDTVEEADEIGRRTVMDLMDADSAEGSDLIPGADAEEGDPIGDAVSAAASAAATAATPSARRRLLEMAREAERLQGAEDAKLQKAVTLVAELLEQGYRPIVFCRFIPTADYVAEVLRRALKDTDVASVTGTLPPAEREERVLALSGHERRVLVCTDCLSEGINLQEHFDAVVHYDLSWNPTRHEQREGRVDRYGQKNPQVRVLTYYGTDNQIDGIVLNVLLRKHKAIRSSLGISVPVPVNTEELVEALLEGLVLREQAGRQPDQLMLEFEDLVEQRESVHRQWEAAADREKRSRTMFAQESIKVEEVAAELAEVRKAIGSGGDVERFVRDALPGHRAVVSGGDSVHVDLSEAPLALREAMGLVEQTRLRGRFALPVGDGEVYLSRTHPAVEGLAAYVAGSALDGLAEAVAKRLGVVRTTAVAKRTTLLLLRLRFHITDSLGRRGALLAEECRAVAFRGAPGEAEWLGEDGVEALLAATPSGNIAPDQAGSALERIVTDFDHLRPHLASVAEERAAVLAEAHERVRRAARATGGGVEVRPELPPDVLGLYVYLPGVAP